MIKTHHKKLTYPPPPPYLYTTYRVIKSRRHFGSVFSASSSRFYSRFDNRVRLNRSYGTQKRGCA